MDWTRWYRLYDARMSLAARLTVVVEQIRAALDECGPGPIRIVSLCSGDGRDVIEALSSHPRRDDVTVALLDLDAAALERGARAAQAAGLSGRLQFLCADATQGASYRGHVPADLVIVSGVLGHVRKEDVARLIDSLPMLCKSGGCLLWNRHQVLHHGAEHITFIRKALAEIQCEEVFYDAASRKGFAVGRARFGGQSTPLDPARKLFEFTGLDRLMAEDRQEAATTPPAPHHHRETAETEADPELSLAANFERIVHRLSRHPAVDGSWQPGYASLNHAANRLAREVLAHGGAAGDRIALLLSHDAPLIAAALAALKTGRVVVTLNPAEPLARHRQVLDDAEPALLMADAGHQAAATRLGAGRIGVLVVDQHLEGGAEPDPQVTVSPDQTAFIIYTSGSTGRPRGVMQTHRNIVQNVRRLSRSMPVTRDDRVAQLASLGSGLGLSTTWCCLLNGARLSLFPVAQFGVSRLAAWIIDHGITVFPASASIFRSVIRTLDPGVCFPSVRLVRLASEQSTSDDVERFREHFPPSCRLLHTLSSSEAGNITQLVLAHSDPVEEGPLPTGQAADGIELRLVDEHGVEVPPGQTGEIVVRSRHLSTGYWRDEDLTAKRFRCVEGRDGVREFHSGDLARLNDRGQLIYMGRMDHRIKIHGFRVELPEVEAALARHPTVQEAVVVARRLPGGDSSLIAYVVPAPAQACSPDDLRNALRKGLPGPMIPASVVSLDSLPLTANGKIDRARLAQRTPPPIEGARFEEPQTPVEKFLATVWSTVFGGRRISRQDDFFRLGGDSLTAMTVAAGVDAEYGVRLELSRFSDHPRLHALAAEVDRLRLPSNAARECRLTPVSREALLPLSFQQERLWHYSEKMGQAAGYTVALYYRAVGPLDVAALQKSLTFLSRRHEVLRTTYHEIDGSLRQVIHEPETVPLKQFDVSAGENPEAEAKKLITQAIQEPFDLSAGPLLRFVLVRLRLNEHLLLRVNHHINSDGPSWHVYLRELKVVYEHLCRGETPPLPDSMPLQYADYAAWQRRRFQKGSVAWQEMIRWWKAVFANPSPPIEFPFQRPRRLRDVDPREGIHFEEVDAAAWEQLRAIAKEERATLYMVRLAAFVAVLSAATRQRDLVLGAYVTNRDSVETQSMFGFLAQLVALRFQCDPALSFRQWINEVREIVHDAQSHAAITFEDLCAELEREGVPPPEIRAIVSPEKAPVSIRLGPVTLRHSPKSSPDSYRSMAWGFTLGFRASSNAPACAARFNANRYDPEGVRAMMSWLAGFLSLAARQPDRPLEELLTQSAPPESSSATATS